MKKMTIEFIVPNEFDVDQLCGVLHHGLENTTWLGEEGHFTPLQVNGVSKEKPSDNFIIIFQKKEKV